MALTLVTDRTASDQLAAQFFELIAMDRTDERFLALFEEFHRALDAAMLAEQQAAGAVPHRE